MEQRSIVFVNFLRKKQTSETHSEQPDQTLGVRTVSMAKNSTTYNRMSKKTDFRDTVNRQIKIWAYGRFPWHAPSFP